MRKKDQFRLILENNVKSYLGLHIHWKVQNLYVKELVVIMKLEISFKGLVL